MSERGSLESGTVSITCAALRSAISSSSSPLRFDPTTFEPYLSFPRGHFHNFRLTPPRLSDVIDKVTAVNSPSVQPFLSSTPVPATEAWAEKSIRADQARILTTLLAWDTGAPDGAPFQVVRKVIDEADQSKDVYAGELSFVREKWFQLEAKDDEVERTRLQRLNNVKPPGDPSISWTVGFYIVASFAGRGLMTATLNLVLHFGVHVLNLHKVVSGCFIENEASKAVHIKAGFVSRGSEWVTLPPWRVQFGQRKEIYVLVWEKT